GARCLSSPSKEGGGANDSLWRTISYADIWYTAGRCNVGIKNITSCQLRATRRSSFLKRRLSKTCPPMPVMLQHDGHLEDIRLTCIITYIAVKLNRKNEYVSANKIEESVLT